MYGWQTVSHTHKEKHTHTIQRAAQSTHPVKECQRCCLQTTATRQQSGWASQLRIGKHCKHTKIDSVALSTQGTPQRQEKALARCLNPFDCRLCTIVLSWNWYCILLGTTFSLKRTQRLPNAKINKHESGLIIMNLCTTMYYYVLLCTNHHRPRVHWALSGPLQRMLPARGAGQVPESICRQESTGRGSITMTTSFCLDRLENQNIKNMSQCVHT